MHLMWFTVDPILKSVSSISTWLLSGKCIKRNIWRGKKLAYVDPSISNFYFFLQEYSNKNIYWFKFNIHPLHFHEVINYYWLYIKIVHISSSTFVKNNSNQIRRRRIFTFDIQWFVFIYRGIHISPFVTFQVQVDNIKFNPNTADSSLSLPKVRSEFGKGSLSRISKFSFL